MTKETQPIPKETLVELARWYKKYLVEGTIQARDGVEMVVERILEDARLAWWTDDGK